MKHKLAQSILNKLQKMAESGPGHSSGSVAEAWKRKQMPAWSRGRTAPAEVRHLARTHGPNTHKYGPQTMPPSSSKRKAPDMNPKLPDDGNTDK